MKFEEWNPGIWNEKELIDKVHDTLPGDNQDAIPWSVWLFENPKSPFAFPGHVDLFNHDCIHILLGRGILPQDEAFVIGFTMGNREFTKTWHHKTFRWIANKLYKPPYQFNDDHLKVYDLGFKSGQATYRKNLNLLDFRYYQKHQRKVGDIRQFAHLDFDRMVEWRKEEQSLVHYSAESQRLMNDHNQLNVEKELGFW